MTPAAIIREAAADGVTLALSAVNTVKASGDPEILARYLPILRQYKPDILATLASQADAEVEDLREFFEERAGILEYDAGLPRLDAELEAARITATLARNRGYRWASLGSALADYPALLALVPATPGTVDTPYPFSCGRGQAGRPVGRQGAFTGGQEVKA